MIRRTLFILFLLTATLSAVAQPSDTIQQEVPAKKLVEIADATKITAKNTQPTYLTERDWDDWFTIALSLIAAIGTFATFWGIRHASTQSEINKRNQAAVLADIVRHLYRNKVCVSAIRVKLQRCGFDKFYPSEEHLLKLKMLPEDLRFERFDSTPEYYSKLHEVELKFRNYNTEVDVALLHLKDRGISEAVKLRDIDTLEFKSEYLTKEIAVLMYIMGLDFNEEAGAAPTPVAQRVRKGLCRRLRIVGQWCSIAFRYLFSIEKPSREERRNDDGSKVITIKEHYMQRIIRVDANEQFVIPLKYWQQLRKELIKTSKIYNPAAHSVKPLELPPRKRLFYDLPLSEGLSGGLDMSEVLTYDISVEAAEESGKINVIPF